MNVVRGFKKLTFIHWIAFIATSFFFTVTVRYVIGLAANAFNPAEHFDSSLNALIWWGAVCTIALASTYWWNSRKAKDDESNDHPMERI